MLPTFSIKTTLQASKVQKSLAREYQAYQELQATNEYLQE